MAEFIDLGCGLEGKPIMGETPPKKHYPCFSFSCDEKIDLPDGEFVFTAKGRKVDYSESTRDPEDPRYRYEIEVQGFKPMSAKAAKSVPNFKELLDQKMQKMAKGEDE